MALYRHFYKVRGTNPFPYDMLRYDQSYPEKEGELDAAIQSKNTSTVKLAHTDSSRNWRPTIQRWESFFWNVEYDCNIRLA